MHITNFTPWSALLGGVLIGLSASLVLLVQGKVAGISGIVGRVLSPAAGDRFDRWFLAGLLGAGLVAALVHPASFAGPPTGMGQLVIAGLLVGFGTRLGNGCTSGHGVCGLSRGSVRSLVATLSFMAAGFVTVFVVRHLMGGAP